MSAQTDALSELIQRFAISALSRERKDEALNEEILVGKYTGEFYIKSKDGIVMSTDIMNREKASTNEAIRVAELMGMTGDLFKIEFNNLTLPCHIDYGVNILMREPLNLPYESKDVLINLDLEEYDVINGVPQIVHGDGEVKIILEVTVNEKIEYIRLDKKLSDINYIKIPIKFPGLVTAIKLVDITLLPSGDPAIRNVLLHNVYVTVNN